MTRRGTWLFFALTYNGILMNTGAACVGTVTGNIIGFANAAGTGVTNISGLSNRINGIQAPSMSIATATSIQNNTVSGFIQTTSQGGTTTTSGFIPFTSKQTIPAERFSSRGV